MVCDLEFVVEGQGALSRAHERVETRRSDYPTPTETTETEAGLKNTYLTHFIKYQKDVKKAYFILKNISRIFQL